MPIGRMVALAVIAGLTVALTSACVDRNDGAYRVETLVAGGPLRAPNGITFGPDGMLYVGSVAAQSIYRVDVATGAVEVVVPAPAGEADDIAFAPNGTMVWTALLAGEIRAQRRNGSVYTVAADKALINPVYFTSDGRLFAAQKGFDRLYEFGFGKGSGQTEPRLVASKMGDINSFEITADDKLFAPLSNIGTVARIDIETGAVTPIAENLGKVIAVNLDSRGQIWAVDLELGHLWRIDPDTGEAQIIATTEPPSDNLAIAADDTVYVSRTAASAIVRVDPNSGEQSVVVPGNFSLVGGLAVMTHQRREVLVVADSYGYRIVDTSTGDVTTTFELTDVGFPNASSDVAVNDGYIALTDMITRPRVFLVDRANYQTVATWTKIEAPAGVVLRDNGDPIVADFASGQIIGLSRTYRDLRDIVADGLAGPVGLGWAGPNALYVTEHTAGTLLHINLEDGSRTVISNTVSEPEGLTVLADGRVAVVEVGRRRVVAIDPATGVSEVLAIELPVGAAVARAPESIYVPSGIAEGADGSLYLTSDQENSVLKILTK
jgi:streptogramin lyase